MGNFFGGQFFSSGFFGALAGDIKDKYRGFIVNMGRLMR